jgi:quercetin dioxygenase-like cupin family protein
MEPRSPAPTHHYRPALAELVGEIQPESVVSRTVHDDARVKVTVFGFAAGQELSEHTSSKAAIIEILAGEARLGLGDERVDARPGAWAYLEPNARHSVSALTDVVMLLTLIKSGDTARG